MEYHIEWRYAWKARWLAFPQRLNGGNGILIYFEVFEMRYPAWWMKGKEEEKRFVIIIDGHVVVSVAIISRFINEISIFI